jgi:hypothetical protein
MSLHRSQLFAVACLLALQGSVRAQCDPIRLSPGDAAPSRGFGNAVAIEGDLAVVVAPASQSSPDLGRAYVYRRSGSSWAEQQVLFASDGATGDVFGWTVALSGHTIVVGSGAGKAYVFVEAAGHWSEQQILSVAGYDKVDLFGTFVALEGDTCVLTAPFDDYLGQRTGSAFVFERSGSRWSLRQRLVPSDAASEDLFAFPAIDGGTIFIGAPGHEEGVVYVFEPVGGLWTQRQELTSGDGPGSFISAFFGSRVACEGNTAVISAISGDGIVDDCGTAYVFTRTPAGWTRQQELVTGEGAFFGLFGISVAISGDTILVTSEWSETAGEKFGACHVFERHGTRWDEAPKILPSDPPSNNAFAWVSAISGDTVLLGAALDDGAGTDAGLAYLFTRCVPPTWNGRGINVDTLTASDAVLGQDWTATVEVVDRHAPGSAFLFLSSACQDGTPILGWQAEFFLAGRELATFGPVFHNGRGASIVFTTRIPPNAALLGTRWVAQAEVLGGAPRLTNAVSGTVR